MLQNKKSVVMLGDSWALGSYDGSKMVGIQQFLEDDGYEVTNLGVVGQANEISLDTYKNQIHNKKHVDLLIFIQADINRNIKNWFKSQTFNVAPESYFDEQQRKLHLIYSGLDSLNVPVLCLGATSKITCGTSYKNLTPAIPSIIEFLCPDWSHPEAIWFPPNEVQTINHSHFTLCRRLTHAGANIVNAMATRPHLFQGNHPTVLALKLVYEHLKEEYL